LTAQKIYLATIDFAGLASDIGDSGLIFLRNSQGARICNVGFYDTLVDIKGSI